MELASVGDAPRITAPKQAQDVDGFVGAASTGREVHSGGDGLAGRATDTDREQAHPALGQDVDRRQALGQHDRLVVRAEDHCGAEEQVLGRCCHEGERVEQVGDGEVGGEMSQPLSTGPVRLQGVTTVTAAGPEHIPSRRPSPRADWCRSLVYDFATGSCVRTYVRV